ncbi:Creatinine amidohydrolase [compost metagenome]
MMHLYPDLVDVSKTMNVSRNRKDDFPEIMKYGKLSDNTGWGTMGNSSLATADKGKILVERSVERIVHFIAENWKI